jgi:hypothetical protein
MKKIPELRMMNNRWITHSNRRLPIIQKKRTSWLSKLLIKLGLISEWHDLSKTKNIHVCERHLPKAIKDQLQKKKVKAVCNFIELWNDNAGLKCYLSYIV